MPLTPYENAQDSGFAGIDIRPPESPDVDPGVMETLGASFRQSGNPMSFVSNKMRGVDTTERDGLTGEEIWKDIDGTRYGEHWDRFSVMFNRKAVAALKSQIDMETEDRRTIQSAGWMGVGTDLAAAVLDPVNFVPIAGGLSKSSTIGQMAFRTAVAGAGGAALSEIGLHATQETRTKTESALNIGGGALLGGLLGAGAGALLTRAESRALIQRTEEIMRAPENQEAFNELAAGLAEGRAQSGGSAVNESLIPETLADNSIMGLGAKAVGKSFAKVNPLLRAAQSPSATHREIMANLAETGYYLEKNAEGRGNIAVETAIKFWERGALGKAVQSSNSIWNEARKAAGFDLSRSEFNEAVAFAMRRNDESSNAFVARAARAWRSELFDPLKNAAIDTNLLPHDVHTTTAPSYLSRMWNALKLTDGEARFKQKVNGWLEQEIRGLEFKKDEIRLGNKIIESDETKIRFDQAFGRLESIEQRMEGRRAVRGGKRAELAKAQGLRFDAMKERAPAGLVRALRGSDENTSAIELVKASRAMDRKDAARKPFHVKYPVLAEIKERGGVRVGSKLDAELRAMDINPKSFPALFKKDSGIGDVDNFVKVELEDTFGPGVLADNGDGYVDPQFLLDAIRNEAAGNPLRSVDEMLSDADAARLESDARDWLESVGLNERSSVKEVRDLIKRVVGAEKHVDDLDRRISRLESEIEDFDVATDSISAERNIADAEARNIQDQLDQMDAEIASSMDLADASPRVKLLVDYADVRRSLFKAKMTDQRVAKRIDAIKRLDGEGKASAENLAELVSKEFEAVELKAEIAGLIAKSEKLKPMVPRMKSELPDFVSDLDRASYVNDITNDIFKTLTGRARLGDIPYNMTIAERGPLKDRTFNIPDELVEEFLENDIEMVGRRYARVMSADVELARKFGAADMKDKIATVTQDYDNLRMVVENSDKSPEAKSKELRALRDREKRDIGDLASVRDIIRGTFETQGMMGNASNFARAANVAMSFNYMRVMGGVLFANLTEVVRPLAVHGLAPYFKDILTPAFTGGLSSLKISAGGAKRLGAVTDVLLQSRIATMAELADPYSMRSPIERFMNNAANVFTKATLLPHLNDFNKSVASVMTQNRIIRNVKNFDNLNAKEKSYMGYLGIQENEASAIREMFDRHGEVTRGVLVPNVERWPEEAQRMFAAALNKDVDSIIVTKGAGDVPLFAHTPAGRMLTQFKTFSVAANQRVLMRGLQEGPSTFIPGVVAMTSLGIMVYMLKQMETGRPISDNPGVLIAEGLDRSGIFSLLFEVNNAWEKSIDGFGIYDLANRAGGDDGGQMASRFATRSKLEAIGGPMMGFADTLLQAGGMANRMAGRGIAGENVVTPAEIGLLRRMTPFASLPYIRWLIDGATPLRGTEFEGIVPELKKAAQ